MKITILGCGSSPGVPSIGGTDGKGRWGVCDPNEPKNKRLRSSILIEDDNFRFLIDCGPDFRYQMLRENIPYIDAVLCTHFHSDHIAGLDEIRAINRIIKKPVPLLAKKDVIDGLKERYSYAFKKWEGGEFYRVSFDVREIPTEGSITIGPFKGKVFLQQHGDIQSTGIFIKNFAYSTDANVISEKTLHELKGIHTWIVGCLQYKKHFSHAWLERVLEWREIVQPKRLILTHMGASMDYNILKSELPDGVEPAWDGMVITV